MNIQKRLEKRILDENNYKPGLDIIEDVIDLLKKEKDSISFKIDKHDCIDYLIKKINNSFR